MAFTLSKDVVDHAREQAVAYLDIAEYDVEVGRLFPPEEAYELIGLLKDAFRVDPDEKLDGWSLELADVFGLEQRVLNFDQTKREELRHNEWYHAVLKRVRAAVGAVLVSATVEDDSSVYDLEALATTISNLQDI